MSSQKSKKRVYTYFEYAAAKLFFQDTKLHLLIDEMDSGMFLEQGAWDSGLVIKHKNLNFHGCWDSLNPLQKDFYLTLARHSLYGRKEIHRKSV